MLEDGYAELLLEAIELRPDRQALNRAFIRGTRVRVQDLYVDSEIHGNTPDHIVTSLPQLTWAQVHSALAYSFDHRDAMLNEMREDEKVVASIDYL